MTPVLVDDHFLLLDPEWQPDDSTATPPFEAVIGLWPRQADGSVGPFRSNPEYVPRYENSPSDPVDALLRLALRGDAELEDLQAVLRDTVVDLALNGDGRPLIQDSCVVVTTSALHRSRVSAPDWRQAGLTDVLAVLADWDLLINPGGPAPVRLAGAFVRETAR
ncbi:hypothetical protein AFR_02475 [Actinoplanes friuliensis DSM 7358]|uniref:Uncharacterized protein n=1 Tax=Actinoplanes friuliensis DSM 7358 TaxID=1246995 RepID=U5VPQ3_9ACTN|nr:hypothetical protein AFR_02475 [Actinoplanes friuliensis DSM 7358]